MYLLKEFYNLWPLFNKTWSQYRNETANDYHKFYDQTLLNHNIIHPNVCDLTRILLPAAPSTSSPWTI